MFSNLDDGNAFNRYRDLDSVEWKIIYALAYSKTNHAKYLWRMLKYNTSDCLILDNDSVDPTNDNYVSNRLALVYTGNGLSENKKVFMMPYVDDAWTSESARLDIFVDGIEPTDHIKSCVNIGIEVVVHNKINNIDGNASEEDAASNPGEMRDGETIVLYKSRATMMLKSVLAELNGCFIDGVGTLQHNMKVTSADKTKSQVWNNRAYFGFSTILSTFMGGVSVNPAYGW